jgi:hypothetical protein
VGIDKTEGEDKYCAAKTKATEGTTCSSNNSARSLDLLLIAQSLYVRSLKLQQITALSL